MLKFAVVILELPKLSKLVQTGSDWPYWYNLVQMDPVRAKKWSCVAGLNPSVRYSYLLQVS